MSAWSHAIRRTLMPALLLAGLSTVAADAPRAAAAAGRGTALATELTAVDAERQLLKQLLTAVEQVLQAFEQPDAAARYAALEQAAVTLHPFTPARDNTFAGQVRLQLEKTLATLREKVNVQVFQVLDEQKKWKALQERVNGDLTFLNRLQDALWLVHKSALDETKRIENLLQAEFQLQQLAREAPRGRAKADLDAVRLLIDDVPPPALFVNGLGFDMVRLETNAGYISKERVTWKQFAPFLENPPRAGEASSGSAAAQLAPNLPPPRAGADQAVIDVSWSLASLFCRWVSAKLQVPYDLPPLDAVRSRSIATGLAAEWTSAPWRGLTEFEREMLDRFGVRMYTVWQPGKSISGSETFGELPFACHPALGFRVFTRVESVKTERIDRLRKELNLVDDKRKAAGGAP